MTSGSPLDSETCPCSLNRTGLSRRDCAEVNGGRAETMPDMDTCGAQDWAYDDDDQPFIYGTCGLPAGHDSRDRGRRIRIDTVSDGPNPFVTATTVANPGKPWLVGKGQTELRADGLRRRWRLVPAETEVSRG